MPGRTLCKRCCWLWLSTAVYSESLYYAHCPTESPETVRVSCWRLVQHRADKRDVCSAILARHFGAVRGPRWKGRRLASSDVQASGVLVSESGQTRRGSEHSSELLEDVSASQDRRRRGANPWAWVMSLATKDRCDGSQSTGPAT